jgi:hypothetical protein
MLRLRFSSLLKNKVTICIAGNDPDNPQPADEETLMEYSQLPLQPKHISNSVADVCKSEHPTIQHLLVP